ncbi:MAG: hypothetical protein IPP38_04630 [Bacteroidetes bacterium]|nr:hypothetical protein [Bacteroidota bacterium]
MASIRHLLYQFRFRWKKDLSGDRNSVSEEMVWLTYPVIDFLKKNLKKDMKVFEYGGGGSTLFFAKRVGELITVEHDEQWFQRLSEILNEKKLLTGRENSFLRKQRTSQVRLLIRLCIYPVMKIQKN